MKNVTELRNGVIFEEDGSYWQVLTYEHIKTGRGSGNVKVKSRNLKTGATIEKSYITGARVQDVSPEKRKAAYLYNSGDDVVFMDNESYEQFEIPGKVLGEQAGFLQEGMNVTILVLNGEPLSVEMPNNAEYIIAEAGASVKGNSVSNVWKKAKLENGMEVDVPLFIKDGDKVRIDTRSGAYIERVK